MEMTGTAFRSLAVTGLALSLLVASVAIASAFPLRDPQVEFNSEDLQGLFPIDPLTDQLDAQVWDASVYGNPTFTLMIELTSGSAPFNAIGVYNTTMPLSPLFSIFPGTASPGWFATAHFAGSNLTVTLFDGNSVIQSQDSYAAVNAHAFGFYLVSPAGTFYSEDSRNGGSPHLLTYGGTGNNFGEWWQCFESSMDPTASADFSDVILLMQTAVPTAAHTSTWGRLKSLYRQ